jgi:hypothetical protein
MISISVLFWKYTAIFAIIGAIRGWAKELLVTSSAIIAILLVRVMETFIPFFQTGLTNETRFWVRIAILAVMTFIAYQFPKIPRLLYKKKGNQKRLEVVLFGILLGALNGYMLFGTTWFYIKDAGYPFDWISAPDQVTEVGQNVMRLIEILPPQWLQVPMIYIAGAIALVLILVVLI